MQTQHKIEMDKRHVGDDMPTGATTTTVITGQPAPQYRYRCHSARHGYQATTGEHFRWYNNEIRKISSHLLVGWIPKGSLMSLLFQRSQFLQRPITPLESKPLTQGWNESWLSLACFLYKLIQRAWKSGQDLSSLSSLEPIHFGSCLQFAWLKTVVFVSIYK